VKALQPCPFCGAAPVHEFWYSVGPETTLVYCVSEDCVAMPSVKGETQDLAADHWNQRAQPEPAPITAD
jgi:hypothetical protein